MLITSALGLICPAYGSNCRISCVCVVPDLLKFWGKKSVPGFQLTQKYRACKPRHCAGFMTLGFMGERHECFPTHLGAQSVK